MDLSIVIPCFNAGEKIVKCIESVAPLSKSIDIEVIVVDDGSDDNSAELVNALALPFVKLISQKNAGVSVARNIGIENAVGNYFVFADSDDYYDAEALLKVYKTAVDNNSDMLVFGYYYVTQNRIRKIPIPEGDLKKQMLDFPFAKHYKASYVTARVYQYIYKREIITARFEPQLKYAEDLVFVLDCLSNCEKLDFCDIYAYNYVYNETSVSNVYRPNYYSELKTVYEVLERRGYLAWDIKYLYYMDRALKNYAGRNKVAMQDVLNDSHLQSAIQNNEFDDWTLREKWRNNAILAKNAIGIDAYYSVWKMCNSLRFFAIKVYTKLRCK